MDLVVGLLPSSYKIQRFGILLMLWKKGYKNVILRDLLFVLNKKLQKCETGNKRLLLKMELDETKYNGIEKWKSDRNLKCI